MKRSRLSNIPTSRTEVHWFNVKTNNKTSVDPKHAVMFIMCRIRDELKPMHF